MRVHLYAACWNERPILDFFFRHYDPLVERYVIHDDGSTDGSIERLRAHPRVVLGRLDRVHPKSVVRSLQHFYNEAWKASRGAADWVIVTNIDEHLHHADLARYLADCAKDDVTLVPALGYQMMSETFPPEGAVLSKTVTTGAPQTSLSKLNLFDPNAIDEINYGPGRHRAKPLGRRRFPPRDELLLLHYKYIGPDYAFGRLGALRSGLKSKDLAQKWGAEYSWSQAEFRRYWDSHAAKLVDVSAPTLEPWNTHPGARWWRRKEKTGLEAADAEGGT